MTLVLLMLLMLFDTTQQPAELQGHHSKDGVDGVFSTKTSVWCMTLCSNHVGLHAQSQQQPSKPSLRALSRHSLHESVTRSISSFRVDTCRINMPACEKYCTDRAGPISHDSHVTHVSHATHATHALRRAPRPSFERWC